MFKIILIHLAYITNKQRHVRTTQISYPLKYFQIHIIKCQGMICKGNFFPQYNNFSLTCQQEIINIKSENVLSLTRPTFVLTESHNKDVLDFAQIT